MSKISRVLSYLSSLPSSLWSFKKDSDTAYRSESNPNSDSDREIPVSRVETERYSTRHKGKTVIVERSVSGGFVDRVRRIGSNIPFLGRNFYSRDWKPENPRYGVYVEDESGNGKWFVDGPFHKPAKKLYDLITSRKSDESKTQEKESKRRAKESLDSALDDLSD